MPRALDPFRFLLIAVAGWMNRHQLLAIDYLREENRILREQLGERRLRFTRMVKELDLFESNNGCGMNGLSNGPCRRTRQHRWG